MSLSTGFREISNIMTEARMQVLDASGNLATFAHNLDSVTGSAGGTATNTLFTHVDSSELDGTSNVPKTFTNSGDVFQLQYNFTEGHGLLEGPRALNKIVINFDFHCDNLQLFVSENGTDFNIVANSTNDSEVINDVQGGSTISDDEDVTLVFDEDTTPGQPGDKLNTKYYKAFKIKFTGGFTGNFVHLNYIRVFEELSSNKYLDTNVEFDDTLLSLQSYINPRFKGSKLIAKEINRYVDIKLNPLVGSGRYPNFEELNLEEVQDSVRNPRFADGWGGDITYGKNPVIESKTSAIFIGTSVTDGAEDNKLVRIDGHSYVSIDQILLINPITQEVNILTPENTDKSAFRQGIKENFKEGSEVNFKMFAASKGIISNTNLKKRYSVKLNEGTLMRLYTYTPDRVSGNEDGVIGGFGRKFHSDNDDGTNSDHPGFTANLAKANGTNPTSERPGGGIFSWGMSAGVSQSLFSLDSISFINELPEELAQYENDIDLSIAGEKLTQITASYFTPERVVGTAPQDRGSFD